MRRFLLGVGGLELRSPESTGSIAGGSAAATMLSLISSAKRNRIEPTAYLNDLFTRLPETSTQDLDQFLPDQWQPQA